MYWHRIFRRSITCLGFYNLCARLVDGILDSPSDMFHVALWIKNIKFVFSVTRCLFVGICQQLDQLSYFMDVDWRIMLYLLGMSYPVQKEGNVL